MFTFYVIDRSKKIINKKYLYILKILDTESNSGQLFEKKIMDGYFLSNHNFALVKQKLFT